MIDGLKLLIDKLSQYNFVTNILPGTVLCIVLKYVVGYDLFKTDSWYLIGVLFYFVGMVNNRFGSLFVEWLLKKTKIVKYANYDDFVKAESKDPKVTTLSTENNVFRSYISVCILSILASLFKLLANKVSWINACDKYILLCLLLLLFVLSYRKQTSYVRKRVEINSSNQ